MSDRNLSAFGADMYLAVTSARAGAIRGEAAALEHADEIVVRGWCWGMAANTDAASRGGGQGGTPARRALRPFIVDKHLDRASTSLMAVLVNNDKVKGAVLTMRKAGEGQQDFLRICLSDAYLADIECVADDEGNVVERLTFSYKHAQVEYRVQQPSGQVGETSTFDVDA